jgi:multisubunit Na+/H+ antiporter MnhB subunit
LSRRIAFLAVLLLAYAWWVTSLRPFSGVATAAVLGSGVIAMIVGLQARHPRHRYPRRGVAVWTALVLALAGMQVAAYVQHPRSEHPTLSVIVNAALDPDPIRAVAFVAWLALGAWVSAR